MVGFSDVANFVQNMSEEDRAAFKVYSGDLAKTLAAGSPMMHLTELKGAAGKLNEIVSKYEGTDKAAVDGFKAEAENLKDKLLSGQKVDKEIEQLEGISKLKAAGASAEAEEKAMKEAAAKKEAELKANQQGQGDWISQLIQHFLGKLLAYFGVSLGDDKKPGQENASQPSAPSAGSEASKDADKANEPTAEQKERAAQAAAGLSGVSSREPGQKTTAPRVGAPRTDAIEKE